MLSEPEAGWATITIGDFVGSVSYLEDSAMNCLDALITLFQTNVNTSVTFDEEESECTIIFSHCETIIFRVENAGTNLHCVFNNAFYYAKEICNDVSKNLAKWVNWLPGEYTEDELILREEEFLLKLNRLSKLAHKHNIIENMNRRVIGE